MKERFEIYDGSAEAKKAKGKSKNDIVPLE